MKITISYTPGEEERARNFQTFSSAVLGSVTIRKSDRHPPFRHIYLTSKDRGTNGDGNKGN